MARPEKVAVVEEIRTKLADADAAVLTEYRGLKVAELADLRGTLRPAGAEFKIFKNTLARRAAEEAGLAELVPMLEGPTAITFIKGDAVTAAKALRDFGKTNAALIVKGGLLGTKVLVPAEIAALADVPPRDVLLARLAGGFQAPMVKAAGLFQAFTRNMAYGLKALIDQRASESPADTPDVSSQAAGDAAIPGEGGEVAPVDEPPTAEAPAEPTDDAAPEASTEAPDAPETTEAPEATEAGDAAPAASDD
ncbi:MAG: 50S ribosomal protein L10 [Acidimicrobiia bacterium]